MTAALLVLSQHKPGQSLGWETLATAPCIGDCGFVLPTTGTSGKRVGPGPESSGYDPCAIAGLMARDVLCWTSSKNNQDDHCWL